MRESSQIRETTETKIKLSLQLDEGKNVSVQTGVGFDHMLTLFARHGRFGLQVEAEGMYSLMHIIQLRMLGLYSEIV